MSSNKKSRTLKSKKSRTLKSKRSKTLKSKRSKTLKSKRSKTLKSKRSPKGRVKDINNSDYAPMEIVHETSWDDKDFIPYFKYINPYPDDTIDKKYVYIKMNDETYERIKLKGQYNSEFEYNGRAYVVSFGVGVIKNYKPTIFHNWKRY